MVKCRCFVSYILFRSCTGILTLCFMVFAATAKVYVSSTPLSEVVELQQGSGISPELSLKAAMGDVASSPRSPEPAGDLAQAASAGGTFPSARAPSAMTEGGPGLGVLTLDDFALCLEALRAFVMASTLLWSGEVERSLAQRPLEEVEPHLVAVAL